jgi:hypothetical protein
MHLIENYENTCLGYLPIAPMPAIFAYYSTKDTYNAKTTIKILKQTKKKSDKQAKRHLNCII